MKIGRIGIPIVGAALSSMFGFADDQCSEAQACVSDTYSAKVRVRYANIDDSVNKNANALTARLFMTLKTPKIGDLRAVFSAEHVNDLGIDTYADGGSNGQVGYATEVDPSGTEMDEAFLEYKTDRLQVRYGRQYIDHGKLPQRYVGTVSWRQNYQTLDGFTLNANIGENFKLETAVMETVYRVIGRTHPNRAAREWDLDGIGVRGTYNVAAYDFIGYVYNMDFVNNAFFSTRTIGGRTEGPCFDERLKFGWKGTCAAEFAKQTPIGENPSDTSFGYFQALIGVNFSNFSSTNTTGSFELVIWFLDGNGEGSFKTPLATLHGHAGWADKFLISTPLLGLIDYEFRLKERLFGWNVTAILHRFEPEESIGPSHFGSELDFAASRTFGKYKLLFKMANYSGNPDLKPAPMGFDATKVWTQLEYSF